MSRAVVQPAREAAAVGLAAAVTAVALLWLGPPGIDFPAHLYQRELFLQHGFVVWNNFWYAGRYSLVTYSFLYYPLAALVGIKGLAVVSVGAAAFGFALLTLREWDTRARISAWAFGLVWPGILLSATFPFTLGAAFALLALCALQVRRRWTFVVLALLCLGTSPLAFALLAVVLTGVGVVRWREHTLVRLPVAVVATGVVVELLLLRLFPSGGSYPFHVADLARALTFAACGVLATRGLPNARMLAGFFSVYGVLCVAIFLRPGEVGGNVTRVEYLAVPVALLVFALRGWRPLWLVVPIAFLAGFWNFGALAGNVQRSSLDSAHERQSWQPAIAFLRANLGTNYRVEAVDTAGHWPAVYLPEAGIPLARGWYRQDDFPANRILYRPFGPRAYRAWLERLAVHYVVLTDAAPDYSSEDETELLRSGRSGLPVVFSDGRITIFEVPNPRPIVSGDGAARVVTFQPTRLVVGLSAPGTYRVAVKFSPYWRSSSGCLGETRDHMLRLSVPHAGKVALRLQVSLSRSLAVLTGAAGDRSCAG